MHTLAVRPVRPHNWQTGRFCWGGAVGRQLGDDDAFCSLGYDGAYCCLEFCERHGCPRLLLRGTKLFEEAFCATAAVIEDVDWFNS